jgi:hypothetical protein
VSRAPVLLLLACACAERPLPRAPLPELAAAEPRAAHAFDRTFDLRPGERLTWQLRWRGLVAGQLVVATRAAQPPAGQPRQLSVTSHLRTDGVAARLIAIDHRLTTAIDAAAGRPIESRERYRDGDGVRVTTVRFGARGVRIDGLAPLRVAAGPVHSLHSALAALRGWVRPNAPPGSFYVVHGRTLYRVAVSAPVRERAYGDRPEQLRVVCEAREVGEPGDTISITLSFAASPRHLPVRIELASDGQRATAELVDPAIGAALLREHNSVARRHGTAGAGRP